MECAQIDMPARSMETDANIGGTAESKALRPIQDEGLFVVFTEMKNRSNINSESEESSCWKKNTAAWKMSA